MSQLLLKSNRNNMLVFCNYLRFLQKELERYYAIYKDPSRTRNERKLAKRHIDHIERRLIPATKTNLTNARINMQFTMAYRHRYGLTPEQKKYWNKFRDKVMAGWNSRILCKSCDSLREFIKENGKK